MGWYLPHLSGYVTLRGTSRTSRAIKAPLSPVPPRHPWLRHISAWAGNLSGCRLAVTLKSTSCDELQCKALWKARWCFTWADHLLSLMCLREEWGRRGLVDHVRQSVWEGLYQAEHSFILLKEERGIYPPLLHAKLWSDTAVLIGWSAALTFSQSGTLVSAASGF